MSLRSNVTATAGNHAQVDVVGGTLIGVTLVYRATTAAPLSGECPLALAHGAHAPVLASGPIARCEAASGRGLSEATRHSSCGLKSAAAPPAGPVCTPALGCCPYAAAEGDEPAAVPVATEAHDGRGGMCDFSAAGPAGGG